MNSGEGAGDVGLLLGCHPAVLPPGFICALKWVLGQSACGWLPGFYLASKFCRGTAFLRACAKESIPL